MIETERLLLRDYTPEDFDALYEILSDPETMQHYPVPFNAEKAREWIAWNRRTIRNTAWPVDCRVEGVG